MRILILWYKVASTLLIIVDVILLLLIIVSKLSRGRVVQYGEGISGDGDFYPVIYYGEVLMFFLVIIWGMLTLILLIERKFSITSVHSKIGVVGFIVSIIYFLIDPFGVDAYYWD